MYIFIYIYNAINKKWETNNFKRFNMKQCNMVKLSRIDYL